MSSDPIEYSEEQLARMAKVWDVMINVIDDERESRD